MFLSRNRGCLEMIVLIVLAGIVITFVSELM